uniref:Myb/SANT-like domain-containing protein n=1 Tax=Oryza meridionalis TaxID=40149 RepID=A0A0E0D101_9ORYZ
MRPKRARLGFASPSARATRAPSGARRIARRCPTPPDGRILVARPMPPHATRRRPTPPHAARRHPWSTLPDAAPRCSNTFATAPAGLTEWVTRHIGLFDVCKEEIEARNKSMGIFTTTGWKNVVSKFAEKSGDKRTKNN